MGGWDEVKRNKFFKASISGDLFVRLWSRELDPPIRPEEDSYSREVDLRVSQSDEEEFCLEVDENTALRKKVTQLFIRFDMNCDGFIDRSELQYVLYLLD